MIEKMQFVSITGPKADIDRVVDQYLSRYEIHLENALAQLQTLKTLTPYLQINPYKGLLAKALEYEKLLDSGNIQTNLTMTLDEAVALIESFDQQLTRINEQKKELEDQKKELTALFDEFENYRTPESKFAHSLDNLQPLLLNNSNGGGDWREHQVTSEQVYGRQRKTQLGSETLYKVTDQILKENIEAGNIKES